MSSATFGVREHTILASHIREYARATSQSQDETLSLHVRQYTPLDNPNPRTGDVTIIGAHANGFPKEMYEPLWDDFYREAKQRGVRIRGIWTLDAAWQGQSGILNEGKLGNDPSWLDYSRDILQLINTFRMPRPLVGVGHSFGAAALVMLSSTHPRLFHSLVLIDPVISTGRPPPGAPRGIVVNNPALMSANRRDTWPSRAAAEEAFKKNRFYQSWDPRVLESWVAHGLRDAAPGQHGGEVTLTTTKHQEVFTYLRPSWEAFDQDGTKILRRDLVPDLDDDPAINELTYPFCRPEGLNTLRRLPSLRPSVLYIFGGQSYHSTPELRADKLRATGVGVGGSGGVAERRVSEVVAADCGHLVPMEDPRLCARASAEWMGPELQRWAALEGEFSEWARRPDAEKTTVSDEHKVRLKGMSKPKSKM